jgi:hypothetical protein
MVDGRCCASVLVRCARMSEAGCGAAHCWPHADGRLSIVLLRLVERMLGRRGRCFRAAGPSGRRACNADVPGADAAGRADRKQQDQCYTACSTRSVGGWRCSVDGGRAGCDAAAAESMVVEVESVLAMDFERDSRAAREVVKETLGQRAGGGGSSIASLRPATRPAALPATSAKASTAAAWNGRVVVATSMTASIHKGTRQHYRRCPSDIVKHEELIGVALFSVVIQGVCT